MQSSPPPKGYRLQEARQFRPVKKLALRVLLILIGIVAMVVLIGLALNPGGGYFGSFGLVVYIMLTMFSAIAFVVLIRRSTDAKRRWSSTVEVGDFQSVAKPVLSAEIGLPTSSLRDGEYCLLLRPFGSDGSTVCVGDPGKKRYSLLYHPTPTLEQVVDWTVRRKLYMETLAVVNQDAQLTPVGPKYLACPQEHWKCQVGELIRNAYTIFLILPPGQDIRRSFEWELEQITHQNMNSRTVLILPHPWSNKKNGFYAAGRDTAARIMALLVKFYGTIDEVRPEEVMVQSADLSPATVMVKLLSGESKLFNCSIMPRAQWTKNPVANSYAQALQDLLAIQIRELERSSFESRYPRRRQRPSCACLNRGNHHDVA